MLRQNRDTPEYHLQSIRSCFVREFVSGIPALNSTLMEKAVGGLLEHGWTEQQVADAIREQQTKLINSEDE